MANLTARVGSQGSQVKELQKLLNNNGYNLDVDGIFGSKTDAAVRDYQKKNGLDVDGIVGINTWGALRGNSNGNKQATTPTFKYDDFSYDGYQESDIVKQASDALNAHMAQKPGAYQSQWQTQLNEVIDKIMNREKFSYDLNGDALYQQYKDKYIKQGKMAMGDAIGQASAMTGGYGNSYAQSVGQQAYQAQLENLNDIVPELYQMAYDKYNQEGQDLYNQFSLLGSQEDRDYGRYRDSVSDWNAERDYLAGRYDSERDYDYSKYNNDRSFAYDVYADDRTLAYNEHRDAIADDQWAKEFAEAQKQFAEQMAFEKQKYNDSKTTYSSGGSGGSNVGTVGGSNASGNYKSTTLSTYDQPSGGTLNKTTNTNQNNTPTDNSGKSEQNNSWTLVGDGGVNWFGGIDNNAKVKSPIDGKTYKLGDLYDEAVKQNKEAGMSNAEAKASAKSWILSIQREVGA